MLISSIKGFVKKKFLCMGGGGGQLLSVVGMLVWVNECRYNLGRRNVKKFPGLAFLPW